MADQIARRIILSRDHIADMTKDQLIAKWYQQEVYINHLENASEEYGSRAENAQHELQIIEQSYKKKLDNTIDDYRKQIDNLQHEIQTNEQRYKKRLHNICMKLTRRDRKLAQLQDKLSQIVHNQLPTAYQLETTLVDPALNLMFEKMRSEVETSKTRVEEMQNELSAWKFTPDSTTGKRLMAKCRLLHNENEELGKEMSTGWVAQLTGNLALQKKFSEEMKKSQTELDEFLLELEEEVEGMQSTIYYLREQLKEVKAEKKSDVTMKIESKPADGDMKPVHNPTDVKDRPIAVKSEIIEDVKHEISDHEG